MDWVKILLLNIHTPEDILMFSIIGCIVIIYAVIHFAMKKRISVHGKDARTHEKEAVDKIFNSLTGKVFPYHKLYTLKRENIDDIVVKDIYFIDTLFTNNSLLVPSGIRSQVESILDLLKEREEKAKKLNEGPNKGADGIGLYMLEYFEEYILNKYKNLRYAIEKYETLVRRHLGYPYGGFIKYDMSGNKILLLELLIPYIILCFTVFISLWYDNKNLSLDFIIGFLIACGVLLLAVIIIINVCTKFHAWHFVKTIVTYPWRYFKKKLKKNERCLSDPEKNTNSASISNTSGENRK